LQGRLVGINPLHVIPNAQPFGISPYSPISRLYKNFIYLDVEDIPEVKEISGEQKVMISGKFKKELDELRKSDIVDYKKVASLKEKILRNAFALFYQKNFSQNTERGREFKEYIVQEGDALEAFALYMTLWESMKKKKNLFSWQEWPEKYRNTDTSEVEAWRKENRKEILFHQYVQWLIDCQLRTIEEEAQTSGTRTGLYYDLAIGAVGGGSDAWRYQDVIASGADVGAPPDDFSPDGQKWGFPPLIPEKLKDTGYELFIRTIQKNMKYGRAIRIDHALGLFRLFWIPQGMTAKDGLMSIFLLMTFSGLSHLRAHNKTMVSAEDLGTIGDNVREALKRFRMPLYRLFTERNYPNPSFCPWITLATALCAVTTHDLPTLYGY
jgi:4-alpha-glucanotransferase